MAVKVDGDLVYITTVHLYAFVIVTGDIIFKHNGLAIIALFFNGVLQLFPAVYEYDIGNLHFDRVIYLVYSDSQIHFAFKSFKQCDHPLVRLIF